MSGYRLQTDFRCADCNEHFESASYLLAHFALHAITNNNNNSTINLIKSEKKNVPDLYPIEMIQVRTKNGEHVMKEEAKTSNKRYLKDQVGRQNSNNADEDNEDFNPLRYCTISMGEVGSVKPKKKYPCTFCPKIFGWSTDLKRHLLTHTGERPFQCKLCDAKFTRNFLLQKHEHKTHFKKDCTNTKNNIPSLKPIFTTKAKESRKQDKQKIRRKCFYQPQNEMIDFSVLLRTFIDKETKVQ